jgi:muramidase (phage lysozyme)
MTLPAGAKQLLDFIASYEAPHGYGTVYGNHQGSLPKALTSMTLDEVIAAGPTWTHKFGSSACGRYQFMHDTLKGLKSEMGLTGRELMAPEFQDRLAYRLLQRRGFDRFMVGRLSVADFGLHLAQEWASFPVLANCKGAHRQVARGQSYYAGDGLNKALVKPVAVEKVLTTILHAPQEPVQRQPGDIGIAQPPAAATASAPFPAATAAIPQENTTMNGIKGILASKTIWANVITVVGGTALGAKYLGGVDPGQIIDVISQAAVVLGPILSSIFRVQATKQIVPGASVKA